MPSLKQGYKFTEKFGYVPEDWDIITLGQVGNVSMCKRIMKNETHDIGDVPFYKIGTFGCEPDAYISKDIFEKYKKKYSYPKKGDILISAAGTIGRTIVFDGKPAYFQDSNIVWLEHNNTKVLNSYLYYCYKTNPWYTTTGGTIARLYNDNITNAKILKPLLPEQEKIAEVLGDIDSLIDKTQQLINKKKDIKTATMQKLLTPRDDWEVKNIDELCINLDNLRIPLNDSQREEGIYPYCGANGIVDYINKWCIDDDIVLIAEDGGYFDEYKTRPIAYKMSGKCWVNNHAHVLKAKSGYSQDFIFYSLVHKNILNYITGGTRAKLNKEILLKIEIFIPKEFSEQEQIATVLSDMDSEIEALEKELSKYKDLKIGIMQQLLTGKIRLIGKVAKQERKVVSIEDTVAHKVANDEFKDAILISVLAYKFGNEQYPLGAFRRQKLSYFYKRHANMNIDEYTKKAMGPYNSKMKYQGAENIAIRNKYVKKVGNRGIVATNLISRAEEYYNRYYNSADMQWLDANFHYENNNNLEVLATVDYAINDLVNQNKAITLVNIKTYIASDEEWRPKLELDYFTDNAIIKAMEKIKKLFNSY